MQCKDIPERPILEFLAARSQIWCNWYPGDENDVGQAMPPLPNEKLALAKMRQMINKGLVDGCPCGCRGDFVITDAGLGVLDLDRTP